MKSLPQLPKQKGPKITLQASCFNCVYCKVIEYVKTNNKDNVGLEVICQHPKLKEPRYIADNSFYTPNWCILLKKEIDKYLKQYIMKFGGGKNEKKQQESDNSY